MVCNLCGAQLEEGKTVCSICGADFSAEKSRTNKTPKAAKTPSRKPARAKRRISAKKAKAELKKRFSALKEKITALKFAGTDKKRIITLSSVALVCVIAVVLVFVIKSCVKNKSNPAAEPNAGTVAEEYLTAYINRDAETLAALTPNYVYEIAKRYDYGFDSDAFKVQLIEDWEVVFNDLNDYFDERFEGDYKLSFNIEEMTELTEKQIYSFVSRLEKDAYVEDFEETEDETGSYSVGQITEATEITAKIIAKDDKTTKKKTVTFAVFKEDGNWKAISGEMK